MPTDFLAASLGHQRLAGAANGVALTTTAAFTGFIKGTRHVAIMPRNLATAVVVRYALCPYLVVLKTLTALTTGPLDYSEVAQDGSTATLVDLSEMEAASTGGYLYVGCAIPFRGASIDVVGANSVGTATLTVKGWQGAWVDHSATDGTLSTRSLAVDGLVTWTMPAAGLWKAASLREIGDTIRNFKWADVKMYWTRWEWSAAFTDTSVTLAHILGINESTAYAELPAGNGWEQRVHHGFGQHGVAGVEALTDAGTGNLLINCAALDGYFSLGTVN